ncbi:hypothetical protein [Runella limosa]|uniref:hypothetical protein n=1 Tax=Runella limosa TaxID=370978 RepID=UPI0004912FE6|nr:hypothetical protein [Runella limosa]
MLGVEGKLSGQAQNILRQARLGQIQIEKFDSFNHQRSEMLIKQGTTTVDYKIITEAEIRILAERQFDAAQVPMDLRKAYYLEWNNYR